MQQISFYFGVHAAFYIAHSLLLDIVLFPFQHWSSPRCTQGGRLNRRNRRKRRRRWSKLLTLLQKRGTLHFLHGLPNHHANSLNQTEKSAATEIDKFSKVSWLGFDYVQMGPSKKGPRLLNMENAARIVVEAMIEFVDDGAIFFDERKKINYCKCNKLLLKHVLFNAYSQKILRRLSDGIFDFRWHNLAP